MTTWHMAPPCGVWWLYTRLSQSALERVSQRCKFNGVTVHARSCHMILQALNWNLNNLIKALLDFTTGITLSINLSPSLSIPLPTSILVFLHKGPISLHISCLHYKPGIKTFSILFLYNFDFSDIKHV